MANGIVSNVICLEKSKCKELIYFSTIICETLSDLEPLLKEHFENDHRVNLLILMKNRWIERFKS